MTIQSSRPGAHRGERGSRRGLAAIHGAGVWRHVVGATFAVLLFAAVQPHDTAGSARQAASSFSGHWMLVSAKPERPGYDQFWFGTEARVTHTEKRLVIIRLNPLPQREAAFTLDRTESRNEYIVSGQKVIRDSRASAGGGTLLISTDTTDTDGKRWLSNILRWSLDADGNLIVGDTEICGRGECPSVITTLTFKRKS